MVVRGERPARPDLGGLLPQTGDPHSQLAEALESEGLPVDPAYEGHVAVQPPILAFRQVQVILGVRDTLAFGREQLDQIFGLVLAPHVVSSLTAVTAARRLRPLPIDGSVRTVRSQSLRLSGARVHTTCPPCR